MNYLKARGTMNKRLLNLSLFCCLAAGCSESKTEAKKNRVDELRAMIAQRFPLAQETPFQVTHAFTIDYQKSAKQTRGSTLFAFVENANVLERNGHIYFEANLSAGSRICLKDDANLTQRLVASKAPEKEFKDYFVAFTLTDILKSQLRLVSSMTSAPGAPEEGESIDSEIIVESDAFPVLCGDLLLLTSTDASFAKEIVASVQGTSSK